MSRGACMSGSGSNYTAWPGAASALGPGACWGLMKSCRGLTLLLLLLLPRLLTDHNDCRITVLCDREGVSVWEIQLVGFMLPFIVRFWPLEHVVCAGEQVRPDHKNLSAQSSASASRQLHGGVSIGSYCTAKNPHPTALAFSLLFTSCTCKQLAAADKAANVYVWLRGAIAPSCACQHAHTS